MNKALLMSCTMGLPVRVVRSYKEKRSAYAPTDETPVSLPTLLGFAAGDEGERLRQPMLSSPQALFS